MTVTFFALDVPDKPGTLGNVAAKLHDAKVNIEAFAVDRTGIRILTNDPEVARACLDREGIRYEAHDVIEIELPNRPGELARIAQALGDHGVNIVTSFGSASTGADTGKIFISVDQVDAAWDALEGIS